MFKRNNLIDLDLKHKMVSWKVMPPNFIIVTLLLNFIL